MVNPQRLQVCEHIVVIHKVLQTTPGNNCTIDFFFFYSHVFLFF